MSPMTSNKRSLPGDISPKSKTILTIPAPSNSSERSPKRVCRLSPPSNRGQYFNRSSGILFQPLKLTLCFWQISNWDLRKSRRLSFKVPSLKPKFIVKTRSQTRKCNIKFEVSPSTVKTYVSNLKIAVVCSSNQNRSMEAHNLLQ